MIHLLQRGGAGTAVVGPRAGLASRGIPLRHRVAVLQGGGGAGTAVVPAGRALAKRRRWRRNSGPNDDPGAARGLGLPRGRLHHDDLLLPNREIDLLDTGPDGHAPNRFSRGTGPVVRRKVNDGGPLLPGPAVGGSGRAVNDLQDGA